MYVVQSNCVVNLYVGQLNEVRYVGKAFFLNKQQALCDHSYWLNTFIPNMDNIHMFSKMWDEITYPFPNLNGRTVEVQEWISNFIPHFVMDVITNPCWNSNWTRRVDGNADKDKVKGQGRRYPSQRSVQLTHFLSVSHQGILLTSVPFVPRQSGIPFPRYNLTLKIQGQRSRSKVP